ncbi:phage tail protein [Acidicapsa dinghuensis]|uniref:Phage tail protein n=1 Tax=Acidicapsa dinghuensis TaxID=2218256 RepID=A0ABW1EMB7_9BACT|nr:tail fiber protein [Acidicapsa dinghuensis]
MADPFVAEIRIFPFNFAPKGWAFCNGQLLLIAQNTAVFSLLGTTYGGDGKSNFALPNLQGNAPMFPGQGPGLSLHDLGETGGSNTVSLLTSEIPIHTHTINCVDGSRVGGQTGQPGNSILVKTGGAPANAYANNAVPNQSMAANMVSPVGGSQPHNNMMPYLTLNFCIALQGVFPPRS